MHVDIVLLHIVIALGIIALAVLDAVRIVSAAR
jgi:hypothetical protein